VFDDDGVGHPSANVLSISDALVVTQADTVPGWFPVTWSDTRWLQREAGVWLAIWLGTQVNGGELELMIGNPGTLPAAQYYDTSVPYSPTADPNPADISWNISGFGWANPVYLDMVAPPEIGDPTTAGGFSTDNSADGVILAYGPFTTDSTQIVPLYAEEFKAAYTASGTQKTRLVVFNDTGSGPGTTVLAASDELAPPNDGTPEWHTLAWSDTRHLPPSTNIWIATWFGTKTSTGEVQIPANIGQVSGNQRYQTGVTYSPTSDPVVPSWLDRGVTVSYPALIHLGTADDPLTKTGAGVIG
jgi:hypothetical protein